MKDSKPATTLQSQDEVKQLKKEIADLTKKNKELQSAQENYDFAIDCLYAAKRESITMQDAYRDLQDEIEAMIARPDPLCKP